ncbi:GNAT family N-acetyltransferase [Pediococcus inopinatus]|uniref:GNAT family N-acetyltransferase n=1 Tax=Pediococcus inopinatus TaxID=114090 RepID=A0ABZ0Q3S4_9LACO|nr:GNAT family protein [Pediococcus inopinatus]WPC19259.1 GNAT family N-acetyltransferase [Pediococcus inopinatus]WPC21049.1 GNAT family N-acetyltransferase [Pediococcus inopinatus]
MTKSVKAVSTYAFENLHFKKVMSYIDVNNTASLAIPKRLGMLLEGHFHNQVVLDGVMKDMLVFSIFPSK